MYYATFFSYSPVFPGIYSDSNNVYMSFFIVSLIIINVYMWKLQINKNDVN